jgi:hypothetical protein
MSKSTKSSKSAKSSKSEKHEKHSSKSGAKIAECMKATLAKIVGKPKHYTTRHLASQESSIGKKFGAEITRAAIAGLEEKEAITFSRKEGGKGKKGAFVLVPLSKKAA